MSNSKPDESRALLALTLIVGGAVLASFFGFLEQAQVPPAAPPAQALGGSDTYSWWQDTGPQWVIATLSLISVGVSGWGIVMLRDTLRATREANQISRDIGRAQIRAYVEINKVVISFEKAVAHFNIYRPNVILEVANHGSSPALDFRWCAEISYGYIGTLGSKIGPSMPSPGQGRDVSANGAAVKLEVAITDDLNGQAAAALFAEKMRVFVTIRTIFIDVFEDEVKRNSYFAGDVKRIEPTRFSCELAPSPKDEMSAFSHGRHLEQIAKEQSDMDDAMSALVKSSEELIKIDRKLSRGDLGPD